MESCEKIPREKKSYDLSFFKIFFLECSFVCLSCVVWIGVSSHQIIHYNCLLLFAYTPLWINMVLLHAACLPFVSCPCECTLFSFDLSFSIYYFLNLHTSPSSPLPFFYQPFPTSLRPLPLSSECKLSDALGKADYCLRLYSTSFIISVLPGVTTSRAVTHHVLCRACE